jgi:hypothetical protein
MAIVTLILGAVLGSLGGFVVGRRRELDSAIQGAYLELLRLRDAPFLMSWRPCKKSEVAKVEIVPFEPADYGWKESVYRLKAIALSMNDDCLFGVACDIEFALDGCARQARSEGMDHHTRHSEWERFRAALNKSIPEAEQRLLRWQGWRGWPASVVKRVKPIKQPFVGGW